MAGGEAAARVLAFGGAVYVARTLGAATYGVIAFATAIMLYLARIADFGIDQGAVRIIARDHGEIARIAPPVLTTRFLLATLLAAAVAAFSRAFLPEPDSGVLALYALTLLAVGGGTRWIHLGLEQARRAAVARVAGEATVLLLVLLLVRGPEDLHSVPAAQFVGDSIAALILLLWLARRGFPIRPRLDWDTARPVFRGAWPLVPGALLGLVMFNADLIFLRFFHGTEIVGLYAAAYMLVSFLINLGGTYRLSLLPTLSRLGDDPARQHQLFGSAMRQVFALAFPAAVGGFLLADRLIATAFGPAYAPAAAALGLLLWSVPFSLLREVATAALIACSRERQVLTLAAWPAAINLGLNVLLIPPFGIIGAAASTVLTEATRLGLALVLVRPEGFRLGPLRGLVTPVLAGVAMAALLLVARPPALWIAVPLGAVGYFGALAAFGGLHILRGGPALGSRPDSPPPLEPGVSVDGVVGGRRP